MTEHSASKVVDRGETARLIRATQDSVMPGDLHDQLTDLLGDLPAVIPPAVLGPLLGKKVEQLANERSLGRGCPWVKYGARIYYLRSDLIAYLAAHRVDPQGGGSHA